VQWVQISQPVPLTWVPQMLTWQLPETWVQTLTLNCLLSQEWNLQQPHWVVAADNENLRS
jgi:hypothetical protein